MAPHGAENGSLRWEHWLPFWSQSDSFILICVMLLESMLVVPLCCNYGADEADLPDSGNVTKLPMLCELIGTQPFEY